MAPKENTKTIASNKKAFHDYFVEDRAGGDGGEIPAAGRGQPQGRLVFH